ncbi:hypothetical protein H072_11535 [Dactylellina haptotyla CBS 200.50]|uniref:Phosphatidate phosphatase APP1 catalytic domain-containing protein n=1 Tax=Dactylellina haptotyla (strain CBS 200.50) TaxID=1284197 RepID=S7ZWE6_DACHA|nr:hypothetical protein H072_11535 [Dactylellina haptotyla CBS 200.50]
MAQGLGSWVNPQAYIDSYRNSASQPREPGARRAKIVGALKAANEARQNYIASYYQTSNNLDEPITSSAARAASQTGEWTNQDMRPTGTEEMILFPSYARRIMRKKRTAEDGTAYHDTPNPPESVTVAEIDVRGWIFEPPSNVLTRKNRFLMGVARQLCGLPSQGRGVTEEDRRADMEAVSRLESGRIDSDGLSDDEGSIRAARPARPTSLRSLSPSPSPVPSPRASSVNLADPGNPESEPTPGLVKKLSWRAAAYASSYMQPKTASTPATGLTSKELDTAHEFLKHRMFHVMARASPNIPVTIFFYNDKKSESHTITTDAYGQFALRAELTFIPTELRVLASERLSVTEKVLILESHGISLISDIDDTIKNSAVTAGVREMARNVFIRDYHSLTIPGITELYNTLAFLDVPIHYVSNSPWQLYPLIREYFKAANLPSGSFHLKQYQSVFQGLFEPVQDRKKGSLERLLRDFPDRRFIMVGDSGEADLEVYVAVALANPKRIKAIFIRDVTTKDGVPFFEGNNLSSATLKPQHTGDSIKPRPPPRPKTVAIAPLAPKHVVPDDNLLDFSSSDDDEGPTVLKPMEGHTMYPSSSQSSLSQTYATAPSTTATVVAKKPPPPPPKKPTDLKGKRLPPTNHYGRSPPRAVPININQPSTDDLIDFSDRHEEDSVGSRRRSGSPHSPPGKSPSPPKIWKEDSNSIFDTPRNPRFPHRPTAGGPSFSSPNLPSQRLRGNSPSGRPMATPKVTLHSPTDSDKSTRTISRTDSIASSYQPAQDSIATGSGNVVYQNTSGATSTETWDPASGIDKKEWLWRQRWDKANEALRNKGVLLISWKKGGDILETAVEVVEDAKREMDHRYR